MSGLERSREARAPAVVTQMVEVTLAAPAEPAARAEPPAAPIAPPEPAPPLQKPAPKVPKPALAPQPEAPAKAEPPPSAAQAAQLVTAPAETLDFGDSVVSGKAATFAGGVTANAGTATHAVRDARARAAGVEGGTGKDLQTDSSRPARLAGEARWDCPFPEEADDAGIDRATVSLRVELAADGGVRSVQATSDPGYGFAREARKCAERKRWLPALDRAGQAMRASALVNVRFSR